MPSGRSFPQNQSYGQAIFQNGTNNKDKKIQKLIDALCIKTYLGCFIYKNRGIGLSEFVKKSRAPIEYLINCREWFDSKWCYATYITQKIMNEGYLDQKR